MTNTRLNRIKLVDQFLKCEGKPLSIGGTILVDERNVLYVREQAVAFIRDRAYDSVVYISPLLEESCVTTHLIAELVNKLALENGNIEVVYMESLEEFEEMCRTLKLEPFQFCPFFVQAELSKEKQSLELYFPDAFPDAEDKDKIPFAEVMIPHLNVYLRQWMQKLWSTGIYSTDTMKWMITESMDAMIEELHNRRK